MAKDRTDFALSDIPVAFVLLTRLPLPPIPDAAFARQAFAAWSFPIVGFALGGAAALLMYLAQAIGFPTAVAAGLSLAFLMAANGAMHEDGLADTADGLWGGQDADRRLEIMKDSRIGTFGMLSLIMVTGLRWAAITTAGPLALTVATTTSRAAMVPVMALMPYARSDGLARHVGQPRGLHATTALGIAGLVALIAAGAAGLLASIVAAIPVWMLARMAQKRIGGQTGDILGACQQLAEVTILLALILLL